MSGIMSDDVGIHRRRRGLKGLKGREGAEETEPAALSDPRALRTASRAD